MWAERGSTWGKWDFHVHTPYSFLNNGFGFNPEECESAAFDDYVKKLFNKAIEQNIAAIGITDYFSIDGYKRIKQQYLENETKLSELFPDDETREKLRRIFVFPNIELRLDTFVGEESRSVNYHVLFSDKLGVSDIEQSFLQRLNLIHKNDKTLPLTRNSIERIGKEYKECNPSETRRDYLVGLRLISVRYKDVIDVLTESDVLNGKYLIAIPVDEDLSSVDWDGRDYQTRKVLYQQCDLLMTSNAKTREWALAKGHEKEQINEFRSIKPCVWGSDAHSFEKLFAPSEDRFCWVKSDPSFDGLQQVLYEPEDRVRIQQQQPEDKDLHQIIDYIVFNDNNFQSEPIYFSEALTTIIGGKSTGKSILLRHIAKNIDPRQVSDREKKVFSTSSKLDAAASVMWKDGVSGERRIVYIPQSWLNRVVDESNGDSQLNSMIREILLQQEDINNANQQLQRSIDSIIDVVRHDILDYVTAVQRIEESERSLLTFGRSEAFLSTIKQLEGQREKLSSEIGINDEVIQQYGELDRQISDLNATTEALQNEKVKIDFLQTPFVYIPGITNITAEGVPDYDFGELSLVKDVFTEAIIQTNKAIRDIWEPALGSAKNKVSQKQEETQSELAAVQLAYSPIKEQMLKNDELQRIDIQLKEEKEKLRKSKQFEDTKSLFGLKAKELKAKILNSRQAITDAYSTFASKVSSENIPNSSLEFIAEVKKKRSELYDAISALFDNRSFRSFKDKTNYNLIDKEDLIIDNGLFEAIWNAMEEGLLSYKGGNSLQTCLERLFADWFYIHYVIRSEKDTISSMSPGKKALVLLELIVNLEKSKCPILIDQPEDDLDNRSIFTDLVTYIKTKKHERQIIVVTHNANVVIGADAEEVIIANQHGKESPNNNKRFEYRCGAIENNSPVVDEDGTIKPGVLNQKGIQEQVCDILEGGRAAFELRRKKYICV